MNLSYISIHKLLEEQHKDPLTIGRQAIMKELLLGNTKNFYADSMVVQCMSKYNGAGAPMAFAFPNQNVIMYKADPKKELNTWDFMNPVFPVLELNKFYHFLCFRNVGDKKKNYYPILLTHEVPANYAKSRSINLHKAAEDEPANYLIECIERNEEWFGELDV